MALYPRPRTCIHPNCELLLKRGRIACARHWWAIPEELRDRLKRTREPEQRGAIRIEIREYFQGRMIGRHEVVRCRRDGCGADIVWLETTAGRDCPVNAGEVTADDELHDPGKHVQHMTTCTGLEAVQRRQQRELV